MTKDQFTPYASALIRHLLTAGAGLLAARGLITNSDTVSNIIGAAALFLATVGWSFIQKHKVLEALCEAIQPSQLESLLTQTAQFRKDGANPLLVAHMAGTALALAQQEMVAVHPELAAQIQPPPAVAAPSAAPAVAGDVSTTAPVAAEAPDPALVGSSPSGAAQGPDASSGAVDANDGVTP